MASSYYGLQHKYLSFKCNIHLYFFKIISIFLLPILGGCVAVSEPESQPMRTTIVVSGDLGYLTQSDRTFSWHPSLQRVIAAGKVDQQKAVDMMQLSIAKWLQQKGYHLARVGEKVDFQVGFGIALESAMADKDILAATGLVPGLSTQAVDGTKYEKGTVMVALFKPHQADPIWRVLAQGFADLEQNANARQQKFDDLIGRMLEPVGSAE